ncbi:gamma-glutamyl kinase [Antarcticimicrobium luteum]|uniref:Gamma-glutamyl kinase n=1 Tax=Antarcticimicrobium luteum TaxID=2547397 RepID=A0A4R5VFE7_9RHOB|nr:gamma-glutamyl kinase [Antarcticimicrobium luteum]TDK51183.1 gamma-glutamyl kinase [Antarcticimicrobium luteum]
MLVFYKERLVFLSVPKTGTTAYETALRDRADIVISDPPELKHAPVYRYNRFFRPMFDKVCHAEMETLAVMREPVSWLGSWYRYRRRPFMLGKPNATHEVSFDDFVAAYLKGDRPGFANVGSQAKFLEPRPNGLRVTHLFRYEDPGRLTHFLEQRLGTGIETARENVSPEMELELSAGTEARYRRKCAEEFALYDSIG